MRCSVSVSTAVLKKLFGISASKALNRGHYPNCNLSPSKETTVGMYRFCTMKQLQTRWYESEICASCCVSGIQWSVSDALLCVGESLCGNLRTIQSSGRIWRNVSSCKRFYCSILVFVFSAAAFVVVADSEESFS